MFHGLLWAGSGVFLALVLLGSLLPGGIPLLEVPLSPPLKHLFGYGVLALLVVLALRADFRRSAGIAVGLAMLGLAVELVQIPVPVRSFLWLDVGACALGAALGSGVGFGVQWIVGAIRAPGEND